ncbi:hypothetical protein F5Y06DRAFT_295528 [Hypoxylon sp. FL0890]|nr:hypothetical protein F5Y06DRAFT_295528 [Hypoxylon sp. FL0890]
MASGIRDEIPGAIYESSRKKIFESIANRMETQLDEYTTFLDDSIDCNDSTLKRIVDLWHAGALSFTYSQYKDQVLRLEVEISDLARKFVVVKTSRQTLLGCLVDNELWEGIYQGRGLKYMDLLVEQCTAFREPQRTLFRPSNKAYDMFRKNVFDSYRARLDGDLAWCVVSGRAYNQSYIEVAHIIKHNVGEVQACYLFGRPLHSNGHITGPQNGIPIHSGYKKLFDGARIAFVPVPQRPNSWKIFVIDRTIREEGNTWDIQPWGAHLDRHELKFPEGVDFRPVSSYLYFSFCVNILRKQRHEARGWWRTILENYDKTVWAHLGTTSYMRASTLKKLALRIGHLNPDEIEPFLEKIWVNSGGLVQLNPGVSSEDRDRVVASSVLYMDTEELEDVYVPPGK